MAIFTALRSFSSTDIYPFVGNTITATATRIDIDDPTGAAYVSYTGTFKYRNGLLQSGSITKISGFDNGRPFYTVTGKFDVFTLRDAINVALDADDADPIFEFLFAGNDSFNGSEGNDFFSVPGKGKDTYKLGAGNDIFQIFAFSAGNKTSVTDFSVGQDRVQVTLFN
jgi:hypothetical protein